MTETRALRADDLYRLRLITDPQIAPDGSRVAFVLSQMDQETDDYLTNIYVVDRQGGIRQLSQGNKDWGPRWSPDGKQLAFVSERSKKAQIHLLLMDGGESVALTDLKFGAGLPIWSPDGSTIAFNGLISVDPRDEQKDDDQDAAAEEKNTARSKIVDRTMYKLDGAGYIGNLRRQIFLIDLEKREIRQITEGDVNSDNPAWSPDSRQLTFASNRGRDWDISPESDIYAMPATGGEARKLTSGGGFIRPLFSPDGSRIAFLGHQDPEDLFDPARIYSIDREGSDLRDELGEWDGSLGNDVLSDVVHSAEEHKITLRWGDKGIYVLATVRGECNIFCVREGSVTPLTRGRHTVVDFSLSDDETVAYVCAGGLTLPEIFVADGETVEQLTHENDALLSEIVLVAPERFSFVGAGGEESEGWLLLPRSGDAEAGPLIYYIHGGPQMAHGEALFFEYQLLAAAGFAVFYPNIHGSSSYGREYQKSIRGQWGTVDYQDVVAGLGEVLKRGSFDAARVGVAGGSYGGYMTNWCIGHGTQFKAAVTDRCLSNMTSFFGTSDGGWQWNRELGVYPEEDIEKLWEMSPLKYVHNVTTPTLVIHSEGDDRTPLEQGEQIFNALRRLGVETKLVIFPEESHGLSRKGKPSRRIERMNLIVDWFQEHLR